VHLFSQKVSKTRLADWALQCGHPANWVSANNLHTSSPTNKNKVIVCNGSWFTC